MMVHASSPEELSATDILAPFTYKMSSLYPLLLLFSLFSSTQHFNPVFSSPSPYFFTHYSCAVSILSLTTLLQ